MYINYVYLVNSFSDFGNLVNSFSDFGHFVNSFSDFGKLCQNISKLYQIRSNLYQIIPNPSVRRIKHVKLKCLLKLPGGAKIYIGDIIHICDWEYKSFSSPASASFGISYFDTRRRRHHLKCYFYVINHRFHELEMSRMKNECSVNKSRTTMSPSVITSAMITMLCGGTSQQEE